MVEVMQSFAYGSIVLGLNVASLIVSLASRWLLSFRGVTRLQWFAMLLASGLVLTKLGVWLWWLFGHLIWLNSRCSCSTFLGIEASTLLFYARLGALSECVP